MFAPRRISSSIFSKAPRLNRWASQTGLLRRQEGMTLIEVLIGMLIISIASVGLMLGIAYGKTMLRNTMIADRALEELSNYMELWRGRLHARMVGTSEWGGGQPGGEEVILYQPDTDPTHDVLGHIYREPIQKLGSTPFNQKNFPYLTLEAYIVWERPDAEAENTYKDTLRLRTSVIPW